MRRGVPLLVALLMASEARAAGGMPQLDFGNRLTLLQVFWLAVIFAGLYYLLANWALPQVGAVLDQRAAAIASDLEAARTAKLGADDAVAELTRTTREAQSAASSRVAEAVARAKEEAARQEAVQNAALDAQLATAEQRIAESRRAAMSALREVATETTQAVVSRLTGHAADATAVGDEVGHVLAARHKA